MSRIVISLLFFLSVVSCRQPSNHSAEAKAHCVKQESLPVKYAKGFTVDYYTGFKVITLRDIKDSSVILAQYILRPKGKPAPVDFKDATLIDIPVRKVICISTNHLAEMAQLSLIDSIAGVANVDLIYNSEVTDKVKRNLIANVGQPDSISLQLKDSSWFQSVLDHHLYRFSLVEFFHTHKQKVNQEEYLLCTFYFLHTTVMQQASDSE